VGAIARGRSLIVVGDSKQLPPTTFFAGDYTDEDNLELEDLESILEDCLALGLPEKHLNWHYRSQHQSLIAFSNTMYYGNHLLTFPSPDELESRVRFRYVDGLYERGESKRNKKEGDLLIEEIIKRLKDENTRKQSIGVVTFNSAQQTYIEDNLAQALAKNKLESVAYDSFEPIFVKNLENVQGDERDVILFSVGYGPDKYGKLSLNFGPINHANGWRRLNVAVTRARTEILLFSSMTSGMIDLSRTNSKGVSHLKAFLEYADKGKIVSQTKDKINFTDDKGIGYYIAKDLERSGYKCRHNVGVSGFRIDAAVIDPKNDKRFILAVMCDGDTAKNSKTARDRNVLQQYILKRLGWNVTRMWSQNYLANPKREIKKIKDYADKLSSAGSDAAGDKRAVASIVKKYRYSAIKAEPMVGGDYFADEKNLKQIMVKVNSIVNAEEPLTLKNLVKRVQAAYSIERSLPKAAKAIEDIVRASDLIIEEYAGVEFVRRMPWKLGLFRTEENGDRRAPLDIPVNEYVSVLLALTENAISIYRQDLIDNAAAVMDINKRNQDFLTAISYALDYAEKNGLVLVNNNGKIMLY
jgi:very-short-patch-repair endonuclease